MGGLSCAAPGREGPAPSLLPGARPVLASPPPAPARTASRNNGTVPGRRAGPPVSVHGTTAPARRVHAPLHQDVPRTAAVVRPKRYGLIPRRRSTSPSGTGRSGPRPRRARVARRRDTGPPRPNCRRCRGPPRWRARRRCTAAGRAAARGSAASGERHGMRFMGFFGRKAWRRAAAPGAADMFTAPERERIEALWRLTALPRAEFEATYGAMLGGFWRYAAAARGEAWTAQTRGPGLRGRRAARAPGARAAPLRRRRGRRPARRGHELRARRLRGSRALRCGCGPGVGARLAPAHRRCARERRARRRTAPAPVRCASPRPARRRGRPRLARPGACRAPRPRRLLR